MATKPRSNRFTFVLLVFVLMFNGLAVLSQPTVAQTTGGDPVFYCDFRNQPTQGSVAQWWAAEGVAPDCINLEVINSPTTCSLDATFDSYVYASIAEKGWGYHDRLTWYELNDAGQVVQYSQVFPITQATFPEDYSDGSVQILINFNSPESDISVGLSQYDKNHWRTTSRGVEYTLNTNCQLTEVLGCSQGYYANHPEFPELETTLGDLSIGAQYAPNTTLLDVLSNPGSGKTVKGVQTYDAYTRQQVTAYLNTIYVEGFALDQATILAGDYSLAELEWNNHGAGGEGYIGDCPLD